MAPDWAGRGARRDPAVLKAAETRRESIIFRDIVGKLDVLRVECDKCGRRGSYPLDRLIERYGIDAKLFGARCPDLTKVV